MGCSHRRTSAASVPRAARPSSNSTPVRGCAVRRTPTTAVTSSTPRPREQGVTMPFELRDVLKQRHGENFALHSKYLSPQLPRVLGTLGFDKFYERGEGC